jgi:hypothetical protein
LRIIGSAYQILGQLHVGVENRPCHKLAPYLRLFRGF